MLELVTGSPGTGKSSLVVIKLDKLERENKVNLGKNKIFYERAKPFIEKYSDEFTYIEHKVGSGDSLRVEIEVIPDDYFNLFEEDFFKLRPDDYYKRVVHFNGIIDRIFKNEFSVDLKVDKLLPVRTIYTNIKALSIDYVRSLDSITLENGYVDWRLVPDGSVVVFDEVQLIEPYRQKKNDKEPIINDLTIHRHRGIDFYFITQSSSYIHPIIRDLVDVHMHVTKPFGLTPKVYQWGSFKSYPNTVSNKRNSENSFSFKPSADVYKLYHSTNINTAKKRVPWRFIIILGTFILLAISAAYFGFSRAKEKAIILGKDDEDDEVSSSLIYDENGDVIGDFGSKTTDDDKSTNSSELDDALDIVRSNSELINSSDSMPPGTDSSNFFQPPVVSNKALPSAPPPPPPPPVVSRVPTQPVVDSYLSEQSSINPGTASDDPVQPKRRKIIHIKVSGHQPDNVQSDSDFEHHKFDRTNLDSKKQVGSYIPVGSFAPVELLSGIDAPVSLRVKTPVLLRVVDFGTMPNFNKSDIRYCHLVGYGQGSASSERVMIDITGLSCVLNDNTVIERDVSAYITGEDGKPGFRGRLVSKQGQIIAKSALAGLAGGLGSSVREQYRRIGSIQVKDVPDLEPGEVLETGVATAFGSAMDNIANFYIQRANETYPIIEVQSLRVGDVVFMKGFSLNN